MTCHNRRETTLASLRAMSVQGGGEWRLDLFLTDDGCTDGTANAVRDLWPGATIVAGDGHLYWASGMALAERAAMAKKPDYLLWLNDDTFPDPTALAVMLRVSQENPNSIVVAATRDPDTGDPTYGARRRTSSWHPQRIVPLPISDEVQRADTFHGNLVLVPMAAREQVGPIDGRFPHAYADDDYGLRATALGFPILQAPGSVATCPSNPPKPRFTGGPLAKWRQLQAPTAMPWRGQVRYLRRHGDWRWPVLLVGGQARRVFGDG